MPPISKFLEMEIFIYKEQNTRHKMPHVHAYYKDCEMAIAANGDILAGSLPRKQLKALEAWVAIHEDEIVESWNAIMADKGEVIKIKPLEV